METDFTPHDGRTVPREGKWHIQLRNGFTDTRIAYEARQLRWLWDAAMPSGDIIAARRQPLRPPPVSG